MVTQPATGFALELILLAALLSFHPSLNKILPLSHVTRKYRLVSGTTSYQTTKPTPYSAGDERWSFLIH